MGKKKKMDSQKPTKSFDQLVADTTIAKFKPFVQQQINTAAQQILQVQNNNLRQINLRVIATEKLLMNKLNMNEDEIAENIVAVEDEVEQLTKVDEVEKGDVVRVSIKTKGTKDTKFTEETRTRVDNVANVPFSLPKDVEDALVGMKEGDQKEITIRQAQPGETPTKDHDIVVSMKIDRVSRKIKESMNEDKNA